MHGRSFQSARVIVVVLPLPSVLDVFPSVEPTTIVIICIQFAGFEQNWHFEEIYEVLLIIHSSPFYGFSLWYCCFYSSSSLMLHGPKGLPVVFRYAHAKKTDGLNFHACTHTQKKRTGWISMHAMMPHDHFGRSSWWAGLSWVVTLGPALCWPMTQLVKARHTQNPRKIQDSVKGNLNFKLIFMDYSYPRSSLAFCWTSCLWNILPSIRIHKAQKLAMPLAETTDENPRELVVRWPLFSAAGALVYSVIHLRHAQGMSNMLSFVYSVQQRNWP